MEGGMAVQLSGRVATLFMWGPESDTWQHTHTQTHTTHTCTHYTHAHTAHTGTHAHTGTCMHAQAHITHIHAHTQAHTRTHTYMHTHRRQSSQENTQENNLDDFLDPTLKTLSNKEMINNCDLKVKISVFSVSREWENSLQTAKKYLPKSFLMKDYWLFKTQKGH